MTQADRSTEVGALITDMLLDGSTWTRARILDTLENHGSPLSVAGVDYYISRLTASGELVRIPGVDQQNRARFQRRGEIGPLDRYILRKVLRKVSADPPQASPPSPESITAAVQYLTRQGWSCTQPLDNHPRPQP